MINTLLIANRGEIACRIVRTCRRLGIRTVAVYSAADAAARHVRLADEAILIGAAPSSESYLSIEKIIAAAQRAGADAIHPGFGFLAENAEFAQACRNAGLVFVGPAPEAIAAMGNKRAAKELVSTAGVPVIPGYSGQDQSDARLQQEAEQMGFPVMVKAAAGGGGKGMRVVESGADLPDALAGARREALQAFGSDELLLEKALVAPRHVEIQVVGDAHGRIIHLGERECSIQRRHQKIIEEAPSPVMTPELRARMGATAVAAAQAIRYTNAGTVEFLLDADDRFYFLEMNTRLQVEHPVTEMVTGIDLVEWQIRIAEGAPLPLSQPDVALRGHAIEARVYAENPANAFLPVTGNIALWQPPQGDGIRVESGILAQDCVSMFYDPMLAKIIAYGPDRATAVRRLQHALSSTVLLGLTNNLAFLQDILRHPEFLAGTFSTGFIADHMAGWQPHRGDILLALVAASLAQLARHPQLETNSGYWRNNPNQAIAYRFALEARETPVTVHISLLPRSTNRFEVRLALEMEQVHSVTLDELAAERLVVTIDGYRRRVTAVATGDNWWVHTPRGAVQLHALPRLPRPHPPADAGSSLRAPMPGSVIAVLVEKGQTVEEGQALIKLEAMKMEHTIRTAAAGIVEEIFFAPGDTVNADDQLIAIREA